MLTLFPKQWEHWGEPRHERDSIIIVRKKSSFMVRTTIQTILAQNLVNFGRKALVNGGKVNTGVLRSLRHVSQKEKFSFYAPFRSGYSCSARLPRCASPE